MPGRSFTQGTASGGMRAAGHGVGLAGRSQHAAAVSEFGRPSGGSPALPGTGKDRCSGLRPAQPSPAQKGSFVLSCSFSAAPSGKKGTGAGEPLQKTTAPPVCVRSYRRLAGFLFPAAKG